MKHKKCKSENIVIIGLLAEYQQSYGKLLFVAALVVEKEQQKLFFLQKRVGKIVEQRLLAPNICKYR